MNWEAIGAVGEILGAAAVLITLIYLARQIKHSNELSSFTAAKEVMNQFNELNRLVATDSELRKLLLKEGELSGDEKEQLYNFAMMFCNVWQSVQFAYDNNQIDRETFESGLQDVSIEMNRWPNFASAVEVWISNYPENRRHEIMQPVLRALGADESK
jgi:hypothetical protein